MSMANWYTLNFGYAYLLHKRLLLDNIVAVPIFLKFIQHSQVLLILYIRRLPVTSHTLVCYFLPPTSWPGGEFEIVLDFPIWTVQGISFLSQSSKMLFLMTFFCVINTIADYYTRLDFS